MEPMGIVYRKSRRRGWLIGLLLFALLTACSSASSSSTKDTTRTVAPVRSTPSHQPLSYSCQLQQTPVQISALGLKEVHGKAYASELWVLLMSTTGVPPRANSLVKIVWRMTGSGMFALVALGPQGKRLLPEQGPEQHSGSNWSHPGDEWGSIFRFPSTGCWDLHASRNGASGDVWLNVIQ